MTKNKDLERVDKQSVDKFKKHSPAVTKGLKDLRLLKLRELFIAALQEAKDEEDKNNR